jgi:hypothetical protein
MGYIAPKFMTVVTWLNILQELTLRVLNMQHSVFKINNEGIPRSMDEFIYVEPRKQ